MGIENDIRQKKKFKNEFHKLIINLMYTSGFVYRMNLHHLKPFGISPEQYNVLRILKGQYPKPASVKMLIERMFDKNSNASRIVDKLYRKNLVIRNTSDDDKRQVDIFISPQGLNLLSKIISVEEKFYWKIESERHLEAKKFSAVPLCSFLSTTEIFQEKIKKF